MSPRGGYRKGAGRPKKLEADKRTASLAGVHITPLALSNYRHAAKSCGMTLTAWVEWYLEDALDDATTAGVARLVDHLVGRTKGKGKKS